MKGFTLIELLIVVAIIGILSTVCLAAIKNVRGSEYRICEGGGSCHMVESYTKEKDCVFIAEEELRICGDYTIKKLNEEE